MGAGVRDMMEAQGLTIVAAEGYRAPGVVVVYVVGCVGCVVVRRVWGSVCRVCSAGCRLWVVGVWWRVARGAGEFILGLRSRGVVARGVCVCCFLGSD